MTTIHRFWHGSQTPDAGWILAACQKYGQVKDWTLADLPELDLDPGDDVRHLSNVARYEVLYRHGGLYLDHGVIPLIDLTGDVDAWTAGIENRREGCVLWFPTPGHPMLAECLEAALVAPRRLPAPSRSGAVVLTRIGQGYPQVKAVREVIPIDAMGVRVADVGMPLAVKVWGASHQVSAGPSIVYTGSGPTVFPLRQVQRNDGLARSVVRARGSSSVQFSNRQRGYR